MSSLEDKDILALISQPRTRRDGFSLLVSQYSEQLYWSIRRIVLDHEDANDTLQNTFLKAWGNLDSFRAQSSLRTWLYRIAINESLDFVRKRRSQRRDVSEVNLQMAERLMADEYFDGDKTQALLQEAIDTLPEVQRAVFCLKYFEEKKYSEISKILNTSEGALKASYHLAVKKITEFFHRKD